MNTCRNNRPYRFLLTVKTFALQNLDHGLILNNWRFGQLFKQIVFYYLEKIF